MKKITQLTEKIQYLLGEIAEKAGIESGMIQRKRKLSGSTFVQTLVFSKLSNPKASFESMSQTAKALGVSISAQGIEQRMNEQAAMSLEKVLERAVEEMLIANQVEIPLLHRFNGVHVQDSSVIVLPIELTEKWQGCGGSKRENAALKMQVELCLSDGKMRGPYLQAGKDQDRSSSLQIDKLPEGSLLMRDLGYWSLKEMKKRSLRGEYWLFRVKSGTILTLEDGKTCRLGDFLQAETGGQIDVPVRLGQIIQTQARLLAVRVPQEIAEQRKRKLKEKARSKGQSMSADALILAEWYLLVTNVPEEKLSLREAIVLARARWQIELLFKLWKQHGKIDEWNSQKPFTILCDLYAKMIAMMIQHWFILTSIWHLPNRSWVKASQTVRQFAVALAATFHTPKALANMCETLCQILASGCKMNSRATKPNTYQLLLKPSLLDWEGLS